MKILTSLEKKCAFCAIAWFYSRAQAVYLLINVLVYLFAICLRISGKTDVCFGETCACIACSREKTHRPAQLVGIPLQLFRKSHRRTVSGNRLKGLDSVR